MLEPPEFVAEIERLAASFGPRRGRRDRRRRKRSDSFKTDGGRTGRIGDMTDIAAADTFLATHARVLERHRLALLRGQPDAAAAVVAGMRAYRNPDGGFGWGLGARPARPGSQPAGAVLRLRAARRA